MKQLICFRKEQKNGTRKCHSNNQLYEMMADLSKELEAHQPRVVQTLIKIRDGNGLRENQWRETVAN